MAIDKVFLAVFFEDSDNESDYLYASFDGLNFYEIAKPYTQNGAGTAFRDPSMMYYDGKYWIINGNTCSDAGEQANKYKPKWGVSTTLATGGWSDIAYGIDGSGNNPISFWGAYPYYSNGQLGNKNFEVYAPDLFVDGSSVYIVLSAGYSGAAHGFSGWNDVMKPYLIPVTSLQCGVDSLGRPIVTSAHYGTPKMINLPSSSTNSRLYDERETARGGNKEDRIDGTLYKEGNYYYFLVKRFGTAIELWRISNLNNVSDPDSWELLNSDLVDQFEGPSIVKYGNYYLVYTDKLAEAKEFPGDHQHGIYVSVSNSLANGSKWKRPQKIKISDPTHTNGGVNRRHGTVKLITNPAEVNKIIALFNAKNYNRSGDSPLDFDMSNGWFRSDGKKYRCENGNWVSSAERQIDGFWYWFDADGSMARNKFVYIPNLDKWVYYEDDGKMAYGEKELGDSFKYIELPSTKYHYYFYPGTGKMAINCWVDIGNRRYHYDANGRRDAVQ